MSKRSKAKKGPALTPRLAPEHVKFLAALPPDIRGAFDINQWAAIIQLILALIAQYRPPQPAPVPTPTPVPPPPTPTPTPTPTPVPTPTPTPTPTPVPEPTPGPSDRCPKPDGIKLGFRQNPTKLKGLGYRNEADVTPTFQGKAIDPGCGAELERLYGQPEAVQSLEGGFQDDPVERASLESSHGCILRFVSNSEDLWENGRYKEAGKMTVKVTYPHLSFWRAQDVVMGTDGKITGSGDNSHSYNIPK